MKYQYLGWILDIRKKQKQLEIEMKTLKKQLKHLFETRETAERQAPDTIHQPERAAKINEIVKPKNNIKE